MEKINTHSIYGFVFSIKRYYLDSYWDKLFIKICPTHKVEYMNMNIYQIVKSWVLVDYVPHFLSSSSSPSPHQYVSIKVRYMSNIFLFPPVIRQWPSRTHVLFLLFFCVCSIDQIVVRIFHGNMIRFSAWLWYRSSELGWRWAISISASCHHLCLGGLASAIGPWTGWWCLWGSIAIFFMDKWNLLYYQCVYNYVIEIKGRS